MVPDAELTARLFRLVYRIRRVEEEVCRIYPSDKIKSPVHLSIGQEAVAAGLCAALRPDDILFGTYRSHATYLAKDGDLRRMFAELYGKAPGCAGGKGGSMHLIDVEKGVQGASAVVATTIPHAVGYAFAQRLRGTRRVVASMFGDGAVEEGAFHESMNLAVLKSAPVVFVCENNAYAVHTPIRERQAHDNIHERARSYGMPSERIESGDAVEICTRIRGAVEEVRGRMRGPHFFEVLTCRWKEHVGPGEDWDAGYRDRTEAEPWIRKDPVKILGGALDPALRRTIEQDEDAAIRDAIDFAEKAEFPAPGELRTDLFKE